MKMASKEYHFVYYKQSTDTGVFTMAKGAG